MTNISYIVLHELLSISEVFINFDQVLIKQMNNEWFMDHFIFKGESKMTYDLRITSICHWDKKQKTYFKPVDI